MILACLGVAIGAGTVLAYAATLAVVASSRSRRDSRSDGSSERTTGTRSTPRGPASSCQGSDDAGRNLKP